MKTRDYMATAALGLFLVPAALIVYAGWFAGDVENSIYLAVQSLRGDGDTWFDDQLVSVGRFLVSWWWFIAVASVGASTLVATFLAATDPAASVTAKSLWVLSFFFLGLSVPVYCIRHIGSSPYSRFPGPAA